MFGLVTCLGLLAILAWGTWRRPAVAFAAVLCLYGLKQWGQNSSAFLTQNRTIVNLVVGGIVALGLIRSRMEGARHEWVISTPGRFGIGLFIYAGMTLAWTPLLDVTLEQWSLQWPYIITIAMAAPLLFATADDVKTACHWTVIVGGIICLLALFAGTWGMRGLLVNGDLYGLETNPLAIASLGGSILIMALIAWPHTTSRINKLIYPVLAIAGMAVILRSGSRGQLIAAAAAALIGWHLVSRRRNLGTLILIALAGATVAGVGWWLWDTLGIASERWSSDQSTEDVTGRLASGFTLLAAAVSNPATFLFGIGNSGAFYYIGGYPHVAALEIIAEEGLIGTALYVGVITTTIQSIRELLTVARTQTGGSMRYVVAVLTSLFIFEWVLTLKQGTLLSSTYFIAYAAVLGRLRIWNQATAHALDPTTPLLVRPVSFPNLFR